MRRLTHPTASPKATMPTLLSSARMSSPSSRTAARGPSAQKTVSKSLSHGRRSFCCLIKSPRCTAYRVQLLIPAWKFPKNLSPEALWLAHYVILSRPRSLANLLSFGLPSRKILEAGPPKAITEAFERVFGDKIEKTKEACAEARRELGWPARIA